MKSLFASVATRYDHMNRLMSLALDRRWRRAALSSATLPPAGAVLDLACGTGDFSIELLRLHANASITCIDITPEMLEIAKGKLSFAKDVRFATGDAQDLSKLATGSFSLIICAFGFRNFPDKAMVLAECRRLLAPGGELVVLELFRPVSRILGWCVSLWLAAIAFIFAHPTLRQYAHLRRSIARTVRADEFVALAEANGFLLRKKTFLPPAATALTFQRRTSASAYQMLP